MTGGPTPRKPEVSSLEASMIQPRQEEKLAPCCSGCASGGDVRGWINIVAQRDKMGLTNHEAYARAWALLTEDNPFPAIMGRVCPHPCQQHCNRADKDGAVEINALERFLGDYALAHRLPLPRLETPGHKPQSIGVVGAGPAGLSFAYQMARRGYRVTVYEKQPKPGGMLYYGIPRYRLPKEVVEAEVQRILDLGVELRLETVIGRDLSLETLRARHQVLFLGIGAGRGLRLGIPGEDGQGTWTGTDYLSRVNRREPVELGNQVVVVGGGNTAVDAARAARRAGADVTMLYRRTREEMPAIAAEVDDALEEGVRIEFLAAPVEIEREDGRVRTVVVRRMRLGDPDASGRRSPVPLPGSEYPLPADAVIAAVSQQPDWEGLADLAPEGGWIVAGDEGACAEDIWTGGDTLGLGIAGRAISQGRHAAEALSAQLEGREVPHAEPLPLVTGPAVRRDQYADQAPAGPVRLRVADLTAQPEAEVYGTLSEEEFLREISRCFSCGLCFGCEQCFMYCNMDGFTKLTRVAPGAYFALSLERCQACGKCADLCPCGYLTPTWPHQEPGAQASN